MATYSKNLDSSYRLELEITQTSQNIGANTSNVSFTLRVVHYAGLAKYSNYTSNSWSATINGSTSSGSGTYDFRSSSTKTLLSGSRTITHNSDGSKSISVSGSWNDASNYIPDGSVSGTFALTTIPRASTSTISPSTVNANSSITVSTSRASTAFTHEYVLIFGDYVAYFGNGSTTGTTYTIPYAALQQIPSSTSGYGVIRTITYNGGTQVGITHTGITILAGSEVKPAVTGVTHSEATTGVAANIGAYVQGISKLNVGMTGVAGIHGSTVTSRKITFAGQTISASSGTTSVIDRSGNQTLTATVTDSRGRTNTSSSTVNILPYAPPKFNSITAFRSTSGGVADDTGGTYIRVNVNAESSSLISGGTQRNSIKVTIYTRATGTASWGTARSTITPSGVVYNSGVTLSGHPISTAYDVRVDITDDFSTSSSITTVPTAAIFMHWDGSAGVGFGKYRTLGMVDVQGTIYQNNGDRVLGTGDYASLATAQGGTENSKVMTPLRVNDRITARLATQAQAEAGTDNSNLMTALRVAQAIAAKTPRFASDIGTVPSVPSGNSVNVDYTFPSGRFTAAPVVQATTTNDRHEVVVISVTTTSFTLRFTNRTALADSGFVHWIAIQE